MAFEETRTFYCLADSEKHDVTQIVINGSKAYERICHADQEREQKYKQDNKKRRGRANFLNDAGRLPGLLVGKANYARL